MFKRLLAAVLLVCVLIAAVVLFAAHAWLTTPKPVQLIQTDKIDQVVQTTQSRQLILQGGDSLYSVSGRIRFLSGLWQRKLWVLYAQLTHQTNIKQGEYVLPEKASPIQLVQLLNSGKVKQHTFTWVEGSTVKDALAQLQQLPLMQKPPATITHQDLIDAWQLPHPNAEGWLFPDTYVYSRGADPWAVLLQSYTRMQQVLEEEWQQREKGLPYETPYEALIMASIIEKETGAAFERPQIAGVFVRRLQKGMRLQTDPTVIYGLGDLYSGNLRRKHLRQPSDYNTYVIKGLPPTPIALPGREAIHAALHPAKGSSLYFVAKGDGTHQFSDTLSEHEAAVKRFQLKRVKDYRSSPASSKPSSPQP